MTKTIVVDVKLVPVEAAGRDPVENQTALTITDDTDVAPECAHRRGSDGPNGPDNHVVHTFGNLDRPRRMGLGG